MTRATLVVAGVLIAITTVVLLVLGLIFSVEARIALGFWLTLGGISWAIARATRRWWA